MIETISVLVLLAVATTMSTFGAVLIVRFVSSEATLGTRTLSAAVLGPISVVSPLVILFFSDENELVEGAIALAVVIGVAVLILGYPISHFATRKLDKLSGFDARTFE